MESALMQFITPVWVYTAPEQPGLPGELRRKPGAAVPLYLNAYAILSIAGNFDGTETGMADKFDVSVITAITGGGSVKDYYVIGKPHDIAAELEKFLYKHRTD